MSDISKHLLKTFLPYLIAFLLGVIVAWKGCGDTSGKPVTTIIEKPVPVIEYVDRWKEKPVRYVETKVVTVRDTVQVTVHDVRLDTLFLIDTLKIVEAWLTEVTKYDTTASFETADVRLRWQNYQNVTENLVIDYLPKKVVGANFALGMHAKAGLISDFNTQYTPMIGAGINFKIKNNYLSADYGYLQQHYVGLTYGRYFLNF